MAATNRWLTAADAYVSRYPTKLAFCSRFRRQRKESVKLRQPTFFFSFYVVIVAKTNDLKPSLHKAEKGRRS
ncbi:hypothetical protein [Burkholderia sp. Leaf177]|uniref:hypothetical protein n=1 Tax=Burkholderia sp. Leaf177 TaxID=1736287 RepID=UPI0012E3B09C|nr:hypothetical protein [Burkholderia sp. Leaf177]